eukprot:UN17841
MSTNTKSWSIAGSKRSNSRAPSVSSVSSYASTTTIKPTRGEKYVIVRDAIIRKTFSKKSDYVYTLKKGNWVEVQYVAIQEGNVKYPFPRAYITCGAKTGWISLETQK